MKKFHGLGFLLFVVSTQMSAMWHPQAFYDAEKRCNAGSMSDCVTFCSKYQRPNACAGIVLNTIVDDKGKPVRATLSDQEAALNALLDFPATLNQAGRWLAVVKAALKATNTVVPNAQALLDIIKQ